MVSLRGPQLWTGRGSTAAVLLLAAVAGAGFSNPVTAALVPVTTNSDVVDGDVSSVGALLAAPGADGISLREAVIAVNATPGAHTITFGPGLAEQSIALDRPALEVTRDGVTIAGLTGDGGRPLVTIIPPQDGFAPALSVRASGFVMTDLKFTRVEHGAVAVIAETQQHLSRIRIERNVFDNTGVAIAEPRPPPVAIAPRKGSSDARITRVRIAANTFRDFSDVLLGIGSDECVRSVIDDVTVEDNELTDAIFGFELGAAGVGNTTSNIRIERNRFTRFSGAIALLTGAGSSNVVEDVLISGNDFTDSDAYDVGIVGGLQGSDSAVRRVWITANRMQTSFMNSVAVDIRGGAGSVRTTIEDVRVEGNRIRSPYNSISIVGGIQSAVNAVVRNTTIRNNVLVIDPSPRNMRPRPLTYSPAPSAIYVAGGMGTASANLVTGVSIVNDTIVAPDGHGVWAESNDSSAAGNALDGLSLRNTILVAGGRDFGGRVDGEKVRYCLLSGPQPAGGEHNIVGDPLFVDRDAGDYHLSAGSPAVDRGSIEAAPPADFDCRPRAGTPDIGAYERGAPEVARLSLTVSEGKGTVGATPDALQCGAVLSFVVGAVVELHAVPAPGWRLLAWSGDPDCTDGTVTMTSDRGCAAAFSRARRRAVRR